MDPKLTRKLAAILYADVDGYSRLTGTDEEGTHNTLGRHLDIVTDTIQAHRGRVVHFAGDAVLAEFDSVVDAVTCAMTAQSELKKNNDNLPDEKKLQFRMGINLGDVIVDRNDIYGEGVNIAARLENIAEPGGIAISESIYQQVKNKVDYIFDDLGDHIVKNIADPVSTYRIRIDPNDEPVKRVDPVKRALWRGIAATAVLIIGVELITFGVWHQFFKPIDPETLALKRKQEYEARLTVQPLPASLTPGTKFRECADCPEMVVVPSGDFIMGASEGDKASRKNERPLRRVKIAEPFAMGRFEITFAQWDACVAAGGCSYTPQDRGWGRGNLPVIYTNPSDIDQYLAWITKLTKHNYRLPSEAEWEYAARAGSNTTYPWGNDIGKNNANCLGCGDQEGDRTTPVGYFKANNFGLFDMHGNVWEWTADCWNGSFGGAPTDGSAWTIGDCDRRVLKGGAWGKKANDSRSSRRRNDKIDLRSGKRGFRIVMTLP